MLHETGFPETVDLCGVADVRSSDNTSNIRGVEKPTIVMLGSPDKCMSLLLEGGKETPGDSPSRAKGLKQVKTFFKPRSNFVNIIKDWVCHITSGTPPLLKSQN